VIVRQKKKSSPKGGGEGMWRVWGKVTSEALPFPTLS